ncbi:MAG: VTT domain-containing protein [Burkholderiaceae bacterium]
MSIFDAFHWLTASDGLMALVAQNWPVGIAIVALVIFCETGLVMMPFLPGDSLLFTAGAFLGASTANVVMPVLVLVLAAFLGDLTNYGIGRSRVGRLLLRQGWVKPHYMDRTREFFDRFGGFAVTVGRFVPVVRTIAPFMAGLSQMDARRFGTFNLLGAVLWGGGILSLGYWLGRIEWVRDHLGLLTILIVVLSVLPVGHKLWVERRAAKARGAVRNAHR